ncbi:electron transport complex subunit RsxG [Pasteurella sp. 22655_41Tandhals]|uniref:electron transport complex subunit RsxG n=1 Tax=Pasteurella sp. 22655_41Tandhals TaxID=3416655 RepID=UPI003CE7F4A6
MKIIKISSYYAALLAFIAFLCSALSTGVYFLTKEKINAEITRQKQTLLLQVVPQHYFDNALLEGCHTPNNPKLREQRIQEICIASKQGQTTAYALETIAPEGYSGNIRLLIGVTPQGKILGVRVLEHHETPGLGDKIETRFSQWIYSFTDQQVDPNRLSEWAVKKDGGKFDQFAGATITPRAIVNQVKNSVLTLLNEINQEAVQ